jgi:hypothetical protein
MPASGQRRAAGGLSEPLRLVMLDDLSGSDGGPNRAEVTVAAGFLGPTSGKAKPPILPDGPIETWPVAN